MKKLLIGITGTALASATPLHAQLPPPPGVDQGTAPAPLPRSHVPPVVRSPTMVQVVPRTIARADVVRHVHALFEKFDLNHDGFISKDELAALRDRMMSRVHDAMEQRSSEHFGGRMHGPMVLNPSQMFDRLDSNHDGVISREEFMSAHARMHARMGGRQEGAATPTPGMSRHGPMLARWRSMGHEVGRGFIPRLFEMADTNHDGRVSLQEAEAAALARFDRMDLNHDGRVTPEERRQARAMMREKRPG